MPLTESLTAAAGVIASAKTAAQALLVIESTIALIAKTLHDAETFDVVKVPTADGVGIQITINIPKFKNKQAPTEAKPLP